VDGIRDAFRRRRRGALGRHPRSPRTRSSSDVIRADASCLFDALATMALPGRVSKTLFWFDAGFSFARRALELAERSLAWEAA
jgi:glyceraldehyde-3-phosphate dehydrogenase/erythrose-4-phosphate dehydrogenase